MIRQYANDDYVVLKKMIHGLYIEDPEGEPITDAKIDSTIEALIRHPEKGRILVLESQRDIVGYALIIFQWSNEYGMDIVHIDELFIMKESRGAGLGTSFIKSIMSMYEKHPIMLETTPSNNKAKKLYGDLGFRECENEHMLYRLF